MIYMIRPKGEIGPVKIGYTFSDPAKRMAQIQTSTHLNLEIWKSFEGDMHYERSLHAKFSNERIRGEWFSYCEDMEIVEGMPAGDLSRPVPIPVPVSKHDEPNATDLPILSIEARIDLLVSMFDCTRENALNAIRLAEDMETQSLAVLAAIHGVQAPELYKEME